MRRYIVTGDTVTVQLRDGNSAEEVRVLDNDDFGLLLLDEGEPENATLVPWTAVSWIEFKRPPTP